MAPVIDQGEETGGHPLGAVYPGESVIVGGRQVWVKPWGVKALMTQVPGLVGSLMAKLAPVYEAFRGKMSNEVILRTLMTSAGEEIVDFVGKTVGLTDAELESLTAGEFVTLLTAILRVNGDFFDAMGGLYDQFARKIKSAPVATGSRSSSNSGAQDSA